MSSDKSTTKKRPNSCSSHECIPPPTQNGDDAHQDRGSCSSQASSPIHTSQSTQNVALQESGIISSSPDNLPITNLNLRENSSQGSLTCSPSKVPKIRTNCQENSVVQKNNNAISSPTKDSSCPQNQKNVDLAENSKQAENQTKEENGHSSNKATSKPKKSSARCSLCRKRVGLICYDCRCGKIYCMQHRYPDEHNCTFDYKAQGAEEIRKNNPLVIAEKVSKI